jgi:sensor domain CHASE-containing protein
MAAMLTVFAAVVLGGMALLFAAAGNEVDRKLDREVNRVQRQLETDFDDIQRNVREELDRRLPETPTPSPNR